MLYPRKPVLIFVFLVVLLALTSVLVVDFRGLRHGSTTCPLVRPFHWQQGFDYWTKGTHAISRGKGPSFCSNVVATLSPLAYVLLLLLLLTSHL